MEAAEQRASRPPQSQTPHPLGAIPKAHPAQPPDSIWGGWAARQAELERENERYQELFDQQQGWAVKGGGGKGFKSRGPEGNKGSKGNKGQNKGKRSRASWENEPYDSTTPGRL
eukprot:8531614-Alexandrium_andersonii.AAC.1